MGGLIIREATVRDAEAVCRIYNHYVLNTVITFEEQAVPVSEMEGRITQVTAAFPWLVCEQDGKLLGYAYASPWKARCAYRRTVEGTVYMAPSEAGKGIGSQIYGSLIDRLRGASVHAVIGGIAVPNPASVALHKKLGFTKVAHFREVGWKFERWIDVEYWERILR